MRSLEDFLAALDVELKLKCKALPQMEIQSIYFGGGTPSILQYDQFQKIFETIFNHYDVHPKAEITIEANPDDLNENYLTVLAQTPINRLSIGIQSFFDEDLIWMNRSHTGSQAITCIQEAQKAGFNNISCDLIFGYPLLNEEKLAHNLDQLMNFQIPHISAYSLTVEERTPLAHFMKKKLFTPTEDGDVIHQFEFIHQALTQKLYQHYEISNYALGDFHAKHNASYWQQIPYLGFGPSAHSYFSGKRFWNISNNIKYNHSLLENTIIPEDSEIITNDMAFNELILTRLRIASGLHVDDIAALGNDYKEKFLVDVQPFIQDELILANNGTYTLTLQGKWLADRIAMNLFI